MVHQYKSNGHNIVLDVNSGQIHLVDDLVYDIIAMYENNDKEAIISNLIKKYNDSQYDYLFEDEQGTIKINESIRRQALLSAIEDVEELISVGSLFTEDIYEEYIQDFKSRETVVKALCLHIAHDCNLACRYCFAEEGEYKGKRGLMSYEVGKQALDFLIANSANRRNLEVDFFGGEPLMNFKVVKELVEYGREQEKIHDKKFRFTLTTNGVLLRDRKSVV